MNVSDSFLDTPAACRLGDDGTVDTMPALVSSLLTTERYEIGEFLGEGGMGRVVKAFDQKLSRWVALKFLTHEDPVIRRLFLREASNQARVEHRHVLPVYDSGEWSSDGELAGRPYIAMRYVAGTLAMVGDALSLSTRVRLLAQVAEGIHAVHGAGLLHRDVKPSNILVAEAEGGELEALLTDFGLAAPLGVADSTAAGIVAGSPRYIAPERLIDSMAAGSMVAGSMAAVDRRSDIYSLGMTMYRLLTGKVPFAGCNNTARVLRRIAHGELAPPRQCMPGLPTELEEIIQRCVAREPDQRYPSARAVAMDLRRYTWKANGGKKYRAQCLPSTRFSDSGVKAAERAS